jgi:HSP20 family protein
MNTLSKSPETRPQAGNGVRRTDYVTPPANISETKDGYVVEIEMPGVGKDGLEITVENNELTLIGRRGDQQAPGELIYRESRPLDFRRAFEIDPSIDASRISAKMDQGVLALTLPKAESVKPRKITVE